MEDFDTKRIKMESIDSQSVWNNDENIINNNIKEPIESIEDVLNVKQEVENEILYDDNEDDYEQSNDSIDIKYEPIEYIKEENQPELGFTPEDIHKSKIILQSYNTFIDKFILKLPLRIHPHPCKSHLKFHKKSFLQNSQLTKGSYDCKVCKKSFRYKSHLTRHLSIHTVKPYHCKICKKSFSRNSYLTGHLRVHSSDRPFQCNICKKSFSQRRPLTKHLLVHTGNKPYPCDICKSQ